MPKGSDGSENIGPSRRSIILALEEHIPDRGSGVTVYP
jgi:hypothetical protein